MVPLRRCGSHALRLRLSASKELFAPYPLHLVDFLPLVPLYGDLSRDAAYFQMTLDLIGLLNASPVRWEGLSFDPVAFFEQIKDKPRSPHAIAWEMLFHGARARGARVALDKSLDSIHAWPELMRLYPDALFVNVVRDPRAQVSSMNRAIIYEFDSLLNAETLRDAYAAAGALARAHPDRVLTLRFEDFIADEAGTLRRLCAFLGLTFEPEMLDIAASEEARRISDRSALWESNRFPPIPANVDKFRKVLAADEIETIETVAGQVMDAHGYERMTPGKARIGEEARSAARRRSQERRAKAWAEMQITRPMDHAVRRFRADFLESCRRRLVGAK